MTQADSWAEQWWKIFDEMEEDCENWWEPDPEFLKLISAGAVGEDSGVDMEHGCRYVNYAFTDGSLILWEFDMDGSLDVINPDSPAYRKDFWNMLVKLKVLKVPELERRES